MSAPRTLRELRAAVARVLVARGEAADAIVVRSTPLDGKRRAVTLAHARPGWHMLAVSRVVGATAAEAVAATWALVVARCGEELAQAESGAEAARVRLERARAAVAAAREAGE